MLLVLLEKSAEVLHELITLLNDHIKENLDLLKLGNASMHVRIRGRLLPKIFQFSVNKFFQIIVLLQELIQKFVSLLCHINFNLLGKNLVHRNIELLELVHLLLVCCYLLLLI